MMIYAGYENGHYYVRLTHDMRLIDALFMFQRGYHIVIGYMLLIKKRGMIPVYLRKYYNESRAHDENPASYKKQEA